MSDSSEDMEAYSDVVEMWEEDKLKRSLDRIVSCQLSEFKDEAHMINYIKKIAKNLLEQL